MRGFCLVLVFALVSGSAAAPSRAAGDDAFDSVTGFRIAHYRAAVPETAPGGTRVDLDTVDKLIADGAVLLDVMPSEGAGADPETGAWRLSRPHQTIPGATWLPDVGKGRITAEFDAYLARELERLTRGDKTKALIVFCQSDCWMGWNAVQRIAALGYANINWFPEGTDGWVEWGDRRLAPVHPIPTK
ncbi:MAG: rhodanese-like domain-containing protein [Hyphomicrobium sp.]